MKIVVAYKWAADYQEAAISASGDVDWSRARPVVSDYDAVAIQVGRQIIADQGGTLIGLTVGPPSISQPVALKAALARGLDEVTVVSDESLERLDPASTARVLASAIAAIGDVDLVLAGDSSIDAASKMTHVLTAGFLEWPAVTEAAHVSVSGSTASVARNQSGQTEELEIGLPAVVVVSSDALKPPVPGVRDLLQAGKKPVHSLELSAVARESHSSKTAVVSRARVDNADRAGRVLSGTSDGESADLLAATIHELGVL